MHFLAANYVIIWKSLHCILPLRNNREGYSASFYFLFSQSGANLQRDPYTYRPCSRYPGIEQNKKSYPTTKGTE